MHENGLILMDLKKGISEIRFREKMNLPLGLMKADHEFPDWLDKAYWLMSDFKPVLTMGIDHVFIYSSIQ